MRIQMLAAAIVATVQASPALAEGLEQGWGLYFQKDPFGGALVPLASMAETGGDFQKSSLVLACSEGNVVAVFSPGGFNFENTVSADFKAGDALIAATFEATELIPIGNLRAADAKTSAALIEAFSKATAPVAYRTPAKTGTFSIIGFAETLQIMKDWCTKP